MDWVFVVAARPAIEIGGDERKLDGYSVCVHFTNNNLLGIRSCEIEIRQDQWIMLGLMYGAGRFIVVCIPAIIFHYKISWSSAKKKVSFFIFHIFQIVCAYRTKLVRAMNSCSFFCSGGIFYLSFIYQFHHQREETYICSYVFYFISSTPTIGI